MQGKRVFLILTTLLASATAFAGNPLVPGCHQLLTERECVEHQSRLATLTSGEALESYLAEYESVRKERERFCNCTNVPAGWTRMPQKSAMVRF